MQQRRDIQTLQRIIEYASLEANAMENVVLEKILDAALAEARRVLGGPKPERSRPKPRRVARK